VQQLFFFQIATGMVHDNGYKIYNPMKFAQWVGVVSVVAFFSKRSQVMYDTNSTTIGKQIIMLDMAKPNDIVMEYKAPIRSNISPAYAHSLILNLVGVSNTMLPIILAQPKKGMI